MIGLYTNKQAKKKTFKEQCIQIPNSLQVYPPLL